MMAVHHQQEPSEPHSYPTRERGRFSYTGPPLYRVSLAYSRNLQLRANVHYRQTRLTLKRPRLRTTKVWSHCCKNTIQTQNWTHYLRHSLGTPASHPPHSPHRLVTTDLHARRCTNHLSCTYTRTSNLFIISSLRYNQLRPTNPAFV